MLQRCAWCGETTQGSDTCDNEITHGICLTCTENLLEEVKREEETVAAS